MDEIREKAKRLLSEIRQQAHDIGFANGVAFTKKGEATASHLDLSRKAANQPQIEDEDILALLPTEGEPEERRCPECGGHVLISSGGAICVETKTLIGHATPAEGEPVGEVEASGVDPWGRAFIEVRPTCVNSRLPDRGAKLYTTPQESTEVKRLRGEVERLTLLHGGFRRDVRHALAPFWRNNLGVGNDEIVDAVKRVVARAALNRETDG